MNDEELNIASSRQQINGSMTNNLYHNNFPAIVCPMSILFYGPEPSLEAGGSAPNIEHGCIFSLINKFVPSNLWMQRTRKTQLPYNE